MWVCVSVCLCVSVCVCSHVLESPWNLGDFNSPDADPEGAHFRLLAQNQEMRRKGDIKERKKQVKRQQGKLKADYLPGLGALW